MKSGFWTVAGAAVVFFAGGLHSPDAAACSGDPFLGEVCQVGFNFCPRGFAGADGQLLAVSQYSALFSLLGTTFGGDGRTTFGLPDLRGRSMLHNGNGPGLSPVRLGERGGSENATLNASNLPSHSHAATTTATATLRGTNNAGDSAEPGGNVPATGLRVFNAGPANVDMGPSAIVTAPTTTIGNTGNGQQLSVRDPYLGIQHCVALQGSYPSRN